jgi:hypothetical protein
MCSHGDDCRHCWADAINRVIDHEYKEEYK